MKPTLIEMVATVIFGVAVLHTFMVKQFQHLATKFRKGSVGENFFHLLGEVEIVFGLWSGVLILFMAFHSGGHEAVTYLNGLNYTEAAFVFVILAVAATRPILFFAEVLISALARILPFSREVSFFLAVLILGPLLGSFITEPAAMTITALILKDRFFQYPISERFKYATLGTLFVNVSIGGAMTHFAAPPVLMVAHKWQWDTAYMMTHFGWKVAIAILINTALLAFAFRKEFSRIRWSERTDPTLASERLTRLPLWVVLVHLLTLFFVVLTNHYIPVFLGIFMFFLGVVTITKEYQRELRLREAVLVGFFLGGLVVLGTMQKWWLQPVLNSLGQTALFLGATALTAVTDNAALTYLGSQVEGISAGMKYALVAGAIAGGGLTVIANAPNPAGYSLLREKFGEEGISPLYLFLGALFPTLVSMACLWFFPDLKTP